MDKYLEAVHRLATDEEFRACFAGDTLSALDEAGLELSQEQIAALKEMVVQSYGQVFPDSYGGGGGWRRFSYVKLVRCTLETG